MATRKSLRDLDNDALAQAPQSPPPPAVPAAQQPQPTTRARTKKKVSTRPAGMATIGVYMHRPTFDNARGAYIADLDTLTEGPDTFARWIEAALSAYADQTPAQRTAIAAQLPAQQRTETQGINRTFQVGADTIEAVNAALIADRQAGRVRSRSEFGVEAILWATEAARERNGGELPQAPARLPNRAMR